MRLYGPAPSVLVGSYRLPAVNGSNKLAALRKNNIDETHVHHRGLCALDGAVLKITDFPDLYAAIGMSWGGARSRHLTFPDLRGDSTWRRRRNQSRPRCSSRIAIAAGVNTGSAVGSLETDAFQGHVHKSNAEAFSTSYVPLTRISTGGNQGGAVSPNTGGPLFDGANGVPRTSSETRPLNVYVNCIIKTNSGCRSPTLPSPTLLVAALHHSNDLIEDENCFNMTTARSQIKVEYSLFGKALSDLFGILTEIEDRMNNNPV